MGALRKAARALAQSDEQSMVDFGNQALKQLGSSPLCRSVMFVIDYSGSMRLVPTHRYPPNLWNQWIDIASAGSFAAETGQNMVSVPRYVRPDGQSVAKDDFGAHCALVEPVRKPTWLSSTFQEGTTYSLDATPGTITQLYKPTPQDKLLKHEVSDAGRMEYTCKCTGMHYFRVDPGQNAAITVQITGGASADAEEPLTRICACLASVHEVVQGHLRDNDQVAVTLFNERVVPVLDWTTKCGNESKIEAKLRECMRPAGDTALRDAVHRTITSNMPADKYWVVMLSDGEDNASETTRSTLLKELRLASERNLEGLIAIAAGDQVNDATKAELKSMADATQYGTLLSVGDDSIADAFGKAAEIMDAHLEPDTY